MFSKYIHKTPDDSHTFPAVLFPLCPAQAEADPGIPHSLYFHRFCFPYYFAYLVYFEIFYFYFLYIIYRIHWTYADFMPFLAIIFSLYLYISSPVLLSSTEANDLCAAIERGLLLQSL